MQVHHFVQSLAIPSQSHQDIDVFFVGHSRAFPITLHEHEHIRISPPFNKQLS